MGSVLFQFLCISLILGLSLAELKIGKEDQKVGTFELPVGVYDGLILSWHYINISLGTPPQELKAWINLKSVSSEFFDQNTQKYCALPIRWDTFFNTDKSSTYDRYENTSDYSYFYSRDTAQIGPLKRENQSFPMEEYQSDYEACMPLAGYIGFGRVKSGGFLSDFLGDLDSKIVTFAPATEEDPSDARLILTLGGKDTKRCYDKWIWRDCNNYDHGVFPACPFTIDGFSFGKFATADTYGAVVNLKLPYSQPILRVPYDVWYTIANILNYSDWYTGVPCDTQAPDFKFRLDDQYFAINGSRLIGDEIQQTGYCEMLVSDGEVSFVIPSSFLEQNCQLISYKEDKTAFAHRL